MRWILTICWCKPLFLLRDHEEVRQQLSDRFRYLLVDEYQDTNHAQYQIAKGIALAHHNICVTGDPDQSIYRWRGADIENILAFEKDWPEAKVVKLEENFRSTPNILEKADQLIASNTKRKAKELIPTRPKGQDVVIHTCEDESKEAHWVAEQAEILINEGKDPNEIAVFYRVNSMSRAIEEAFVQRQFAVPSCSWRRVLRSQRNTGSVGLSKSDGQSPRTILPMFGLWARTRVVLARHRLIGLIQFGRINGLSLLEAGLRAEEVETINRPTRGRIIEFSKMIQSFCDDVTGKVAPLMERVFC